MLTSIGLRFVAASLVAGGVFWAAAGESAETVPAAEQPKAPGADDKNLIAEVRGKLVVSSGWVDVSGLRNRHVVVQMTAPAAAASDSPMTTVEFSKDGATVDQAWQYEPPTVARESYAPRWLITHPYVSVTVGKTSEEWTRSARTDRPVVNADGRPSVNNPPLSALGQKFSALAYAGAHGGPARIEGGPNRRYRITDLRNGTLVNWNLRPDGTASRVDVHEDGMRAHAGGTPNFVTQTPRQWDRGSGTLHAVIRHHGGESVAMDFATFWRANKDKGYSWMVRYPANGDWQFTIARKSVRWDKLPNIWDGKRHVLTVAWSPDAPWTMWIDGVAYPAGKHDVSGAEVPHDSCESSFLSTSTVVRMVAQMFGIAAKRMSDKEIAEYHAAPYAWAEQ